METFFDGQDNIKAIYFPGEVGGFISIDSEKIEKISVSMENGQMSYVPWFVVWEDGKIKYKYNSAHIESVEFK